MFPGKRSLDPLETIKRQKQWATIRKTALKKKLDGREFGREKDLGTSAVTFIIFLLGEWRAGAIAAYRRLSKSGVFLRERELGMCSLLPVRKVDLIVDLVKAPDDLGRWAVEQGEQPFTLHERGFETLGVEASRHRDSQR